MNSSKCSQTEINLSVVANNIVANAALVSYHLFCPFCADFYLFEFSFKDHLKAEHSDLLQKHFKCINRCDDHETVGDDPKKLIFKSEFGHGCDLCGAMFKYATLIPKHILNYHGSNYYALWQRGQQQTLNAKRNSDSSDETTIRIDPTVLYAKCSPGLSEIFERISTHDIDGDDDLTVDRTPLKSILKKSATKSARIISSPSSSCIRRIKNTTAVKRTSSARRVLRFDITNSSPTQFENIPFGQADLNHNERKSPRKKKKKTMGKLVRRILFGQCATKSQRKKIKNRHMVTSTPINLIDDAFY